MTAREKPRLNHSPLFGVICCVFDYPKFKRSVVVGFLAVLPQCVEFAGVPWMDPSDVRDERSVIVSVSLRCEVGVLNRMLQHFVKCCVVVTTACGA